MIKQLKGVIHRIRNQPKLDDDPFVYPMGFGASQRRIFCVLALITICRGWSVGSLPYYLSFHYYCPRGERYANDQNKCVEACRSTTPSGLMKYDVIIVCDSEIRNVQRWFSLGGSIGGFVLGALTDYFGRKKILNISSIGLILGCLIITLSRSRVVFLLGVFLRITFINGSLIAGFVLISEIMGRKKLGIMITFMFAFNDLGTIALIIAAFTIGHWRIIEIVMLVTSFTLLTGFCFVWETPRFYFHRNKVDKAVQRLKFLVEKNHLSSNGIEERLEKLYRDYHTQPLSDDRFYKIYKYNRLWSIFWIFLFLQFLTSLMFNLDRIILPTFPKHTFQFAILTNGVIAFCRIAFSMLLRRLANKDVLYVALIFNCLGELIIAILSTTNTNSTIWIITIAEGITWAVINPVLVTYYIEIFPTNMRGTIHGVFFITDLLGTQCAFFIATLSKKCVWLPGFLNFSFSFLACCVSTSLPKLEKNPLPQTTRDAEFYARNKNPYHPLYAQDPQEYKDVPDMDPTLKTS